MLQREKTLSKVSAEITTNEKKITSSAETMRGVYLSTGQGHPAENSSDDTHDNANVRGDESTESEWSYGSATE